MDAHKYPCTLLESLPRKARVDSDGSGKVQPKDPAEDVVGIQLPVELPTLYSRRCVSNGRCQLL